MRPTEGHGAALLFLLGNDMSVLERDKEEILRLRGEVEILQEKIKTDAAGYTKERERLHDDIARLNGVIFRIKHYAADFEDVMEILRLESNRK